VSTGSRVDLFNALTCLDLSALASKSTRLDFLALALGSGGIVNPSGIVCSGNQVHPSRRIGSSGKVDLSRHIGSGNQVNPSKCQMAAESTHFDAVTCLCLDFLPLVLSSGGLVNPSRLVCSGGQVHPSRRIGSSGIDPFRHIPGGILEMSEVSLEAESTHFDVSTCLDLSALVAVTCLDLLDPVEDL